MDLISSGFWVSASWAVAIIGENMARVTTKISKAGVDRNKFLNFVLIRRIKWELNLFVWIAKSLIIFTLGPHIVFFIKIFLYIIVFKFHFTTPINKYFSTAGNSSILLRSPLLDFYTWTFSRSATT